MEMKDKFSRGRLDARQQPARQASDQSRIFTMHVTFLQNKKTAAANVEFSGKSKIRLSLVPLRISARTGSSGLSAPFCPVAFFVKSRPIRKMVGRGGGVQTQPPLGAQQLWGRGQDDACCGLDCGLEISVFSPFSG